MYMSIFSAWNHAAFGCRSAVTRPVWKSSYRRQMFAGLFWTRMVCYLDNRARAARFMRPVTRRQGPPLLRAIGTRAGKSGARTKAILAIPHTVSFTGTLVSMFRWNIWDRLRGESEKFSGIKYHRIT